MDARVIPGKVSAKQHHLLVSDFRADIPPSAKKKNRPSPKDLTPQAARVSNRVQKAFITETTLNNVIASGTKET